MASTEKKSKKTKRARLGRGLGALIEQGSTPSVSIDLEQRQAGKTEQDVNNIDRADDEGSGERVLEIEVGAIEPNPHQPRRVFDEQALEALADSIRAHGLMQPIVVRRSGGGYELVAGERRWRAAKSAGMKTIRALLSEADDERSAELALIENIQRSDLNPIERAMGFSQLIERFGMTQQQLADRMGMSRPALANQLRLLELEDELRDMVARGELSVGHAKVLLSCPSVERRKSLAKQCIDESWTVRLLVDRVSDEPKNRPETPKSSDGHQPADHGRLHSVLRDMERQMSEQLGTRVTLKTDAKGSKGRVIIEFYDLDQFDGLLARLGVSSTDSLA